MKTAKKSWPGFWSSWLTILLRP